MFTIKLMETRVFPGVADDTPSYRQTIKLIEASQIQVHNLRPNNVLWEVAGTDANGDSFAHYIWPDEARAAEQKPCPEQPSGFGPGMTFYYACFIENARGQTTHSIK